MSGDLKDKADQHNEKLNAPNVSFQILDAAPDMLDRPVRLVKGKAFVATWVPVQMTVRRAEDKDTGDIIEYDPPKVETHHRLVVIDGNGQMYADPRDNVPRAEPFTKAGIEIRLPSESPPGRLLSGKGLMAYANGQRTDVRQLFLDIAEVIDAYIDFRGCFADQDTMCRLVATYILSTAFLDAFPVIGYLWIFGESGSGKTQLLLMVYLLSVMGSLVANAGSMAALRDIAAAGGSLCIDDAEKITGGDVDPEKQSLLLAGNRRGATVVLKEPAADGKGWKQKSVPVFCPRSFSATTLPIQTLRNRCIVLPMVASNDTQKANGTPEDETTWPNGLTGTDIADRIWMTVLEHLPAMPGYDQDASKSARLHGRTYQVWRGVFATALWLDHQGVTGLFDEIERTAEAYQGDVLLAAKESRTHIVLVALAELVEEGAGSAEGDGRVMPTKLITKRANWIAKERELADDDQDLYTSFLVGCTMRNLRIDKPGSRDSNTRAWLVRPATVRRLMDAHGMLALTSPDTHIQVSQVSEASEVSQNAQDYPPAGDTCDASDTYDTWFGGVEPLSAPPQNSDGNDGNDGFKVEGGDMFEEVL